MECPIYIFLCVITKSNNVYCLGLYAVVLCFLLFILSLHGIKNGKEILPIPKEIINDYNYSDYKFDLRFGHNYFKFMDERYKEWVEKSKRK